MSTYPTPGVYVEEVSFRAKSIEGVDTSTAGFAGMVLRGPVGAGGGAASAAPRLVTSFAEFERYFGGLEPLQLQGGLERPAYLAHAARAFFDNGGRRLYVSRVFRPGNGGDGVARLTVLLDGGATATWLARWPGRSGNVRLQVAPRRSRNVAFETTMGGVKVVQAKGAARGAVVEIITPRGVRPPRRGALNPNLLYGVAVGARGKQTFYGRNGVRFTPPPGARIRLLTLDVAVADAPQAELHLGLGLHPAHGRFIGRVLGGDDAAAESGLVRLEWDPDTLGTATRRRLAAAVRLAVALVATPGGRLAGGDDGRMIDGATLRGAAAGEAGSAGATGLAALAGVDDVALIAAPDASTLETEGERSLAAQYLVAHAEAQRYRMALLDSPPGASLSDVRAFRAPLDSSYAALYYPWLIVADPLQSGGSAAPRELALPPCGFVAGLIARNDLDRGVHRAPANLEVSGVLRLEAEVGKAQQDVLNPEGINLLRRFEARGVRVWGARTLSSDPEWKYVNVRRLFIYLEHSIARGTQWAVFEPNGEPLWSAVRRTIEDFLFGLWRNGVLLGMKPEEAYFVRCDRSTMTQNDLDNGRLVALIGVAPLRPAEFVIFRIGLWTATHQGDPDT